MEGTGCGHSQAPPPLPRHGQYPPPPKGNGVNPSSHLNNTSDKYNENSVWKTVKTHSFFYIPRIQAPFNIEKNVIGIDLGTSRCCVAVIRKNGITTVPLDNTGERLLPSYVSYDEKNVKCGQIVVERLRNYSKSTIFDSKRIIGRMEKRLLFRKKFLQNF
uniref:Heat shock protein 70 n=1 Tax=Panagrolaimus davidi TaxID=227884 RepID=A0A914PET9_9BILA